MKRYATPEQTVGAIKQVFADNPGGELTAYDIKSRAERLVSVRSDRFWPALMEIQRQGLIEPVFKGRLTRYRVKVAEVAA